MLLLGGGRSGGEGENEHDIMQCVGNLELGWIDIFFSWLFRFLIFRNRIGLSRKKIMYKIEGVMVLSHYQSI